MAALDEKVPAIAEQVLKRPLSDAETLEIYRIADAVGMRDVQSFLHLLLVFKLHEDKTREQFEKLVSLEARLNAKFDDMGVLSERIRETLESSIEKNFGDRARWIGEDMGKTIASSAESLLTSVGEYHSLRGRTVIVCYTCLVSVIAYWLGSGGVPPRNVPSGVLEAFLFLPAGWCVFFCGAVYSFLWAGDYWNRIKKTSLYKTLLGLQVFSLIWLALALL
jgi:hypothetical protein